VIETSQQPMRTAGALALVVVLVLLVMAVAWGQGMAELNPPGSSTTAPIYTDEPTESPEAPDEWDEGVPAETESTDFAIFVVVFGAVLLALLTRGIFSLIRRLMADQKPPVRDGVEISAVSVGSAVSDESVAEIVRTGIAGALHRIDQGAEPGDAIVAAWVGLEQSAAKAGLKRAAAETPGEFAVRIIARREVVASHAEVLLALYERVRFGDYTAAEHDRLRAREALQAIEVAWR
jgi:hypothetical protein